MPTGKAEKPDNVKTISIDHVPSSGVNDALSLIPTCIAEPAERDCRFEAGFKTRREDLADRSVEQTHMIDRDWAEAFARDWIAAWNAHDLERILDHYADDFEMTSPLIVERLGVHNGRLRGKEAIRAYWSQGLAMTPALRFELFEVLAGVRSVAMLYKNVTARRMVLERVELDEHLRGIRAEALHGPSE